MKCSHCNETADFKCTTCQQPFMCKFHLGDHQITMDNHLSEKLDKVFDGSRLSQLRSKLMKRIQKINTAKNELSKNSKYLIESIERACEQVWDNLDAVNSTYFELLKRFKFCGSELQTIEEIESLDVRIQTIAVDGITALVKKAYYIDLISFEINVEEEINVFKKMTLKQRIECMKTKFDLKVDLNYCHERGKEVLVSNDGKYLFFCMIQ